VTPKSSSVDKLAAKLERAHRLAINALAAYYRAGTGTATSRKSYERYEHYTSSFEELIRELRAAIGAAASNTSERTRS